MGNIEWGSIPADTASGAAKTIVNNGSYVYELGYKHISVNVPSPIANRASFFYKATQPLQIIRVDSCVKAATNVVFNISIHSDPTLIGVEIMSDQTAVTGGASTTTFISGQNTMAANDWLFINLKTVSGSPLFLSVTVVAALM